MTTQKLEQSDSEGNEEAGLFRSWISQSLEVGLWIVEYQRCISNECQTMIVVKYQRVNECHFHWRTMKDNCTTTTSTTSNIPMCIVRSYNYVLFGKERIILYQGKVSKSFLHMTLTKSNNKSMLIGQASLTTLMMCWHSSTSLFNIYINDWRLEEITRLCNTFQVLLLCQNIYTSNT